MLDKLVAITQKLSPTLRQVASNASWLLVDRILQMGLGLAVGIWVARYLQPQDYGLLTYAISFVSIFGAITQLGLGTIVIRDIARDPSCKDETLGTAFTLQVIGGLITLILTVGIISWLKPDEVLIRWLVGIVAAGNLFQAFRTINYWFQSQLLSQYIVIPNNLVSILNAILRIGLIQAQVTVVAFAWANFAESAFRGLAMAIAYRLNGNRFRWRFNPWRAKQLIQESWPLILSGLAIYVYSKIDQVMLGSLLADTTELGYYSVAVKLSEVFNFIPMIIGQSVFPKLAQLKAKNSEQYFRTFQIYFDIMMLTWLLVAVPTSLLSTYIVPLLYGKAYIASSTILSIYVWAQFGSNFGVARSNYLSVEGKLQYSLYLTTSGAVVNVALNAVMIPHYGAIGATVATLITYFFVTIFLNFIFKDLRLIGTMILRSLNLYQACQRVISLVR